MKHAKKIFVLLFVLTLMFSFQVAWAGGGKEKEVEQVEIVGEWTLAKAAAPWKGKTMRMIGEALPPLEALDQVKADFEQQTGVKVVIEQYGHAEVIEKEMADFVGKTGTYDLILAPHREIGIFVTNEWVIPIDRFMNDPNLHDPDFSLEGAWISEYLWREVSWYGEKAYGFPFHIISMYLWYRYDVMEHPDEAKTFKAKYGYDIPVPPVTWEEFYDLSEFFTRTKGQKLAGKVLDHDFFGHTMQGRRHVATFYWFLNPLYSWGGRMVRVPGQGSEYGPVEFDSPAAVETLNYSMSIIPFAPPGVMTYGWDESQAAIQQGLAAMGWQWDDAVGAVENPEESLVAGKIAYSGIPIEKEKIMQVEGWGYYVPLSSKKPELAWLFIQWAMGLETQIAQMERGGQSPIRVIYDDPRVKKLPYIPTALYLKTGGKDVIGVREFGDPTGWGVPRRFLEAKNPARGDTSVSLIPKPTFPEQAEIVDEMILAINAAFSGEMSAKEALKKFADSARSVAPDKLK